VIGGLEACSREDLAILLPEYLLAGHLIDRAGMPHLISMFGREVMRDIAIDEWMAASPVYTRRMQRALRFEGDSVETIFKGLQLDIGAPPQFMDFRFRLHDHDHGEFWLDHCGALMDVEPMGNDYVFAMCHEIEDPTFDATAIATNPRARVRPVHRPPRRPADRHPHCQWTVDISPEHDPLPVPPAADRLGATWAATTVLAEADPSEPGAREYSGPLQSDIRFGDWSRSTLVRLAEEACLQGHLLVLAFIDAVDRRTGDRDDVLALARKQFTGVAGVAAGRLQGALGLGGGLEAAARVLALHPAFLPRAYVGLEVDLSDRLMVTVRPDRSGVDGAWPGLLDHHHLEPLDAIVQAVDPTLRCRPIPSASSSGREALSVEVVPGGEPRKPCAEVELTRFSTGSDFVFQARPTPVEVRSGG